MNVCILAALTESTGNTTTARRLHSHLRDRHNVLLVDVYDLDVEKLHTILARHRTDLLIGLHALLSGPFLQRANRPFVLVLTGTDVYQGMHELHIRQMRRAVACATKIVSYSERNLQKASERFPDIAARSICIPKSISVADVDSSFDLREYLTLPDDSRIVLLPASIREVKDPSHLITAFARRHSEDPRVHLVLAGPVLEESTAERLYALVRQSPGVRYAGVLPRPEMLAAIAQANVVLNSSITEGFSNALLEAMALETPIVARENGGNGSLVRDGETGFLYSHPYQAVRAADLLMDSDVTRRGITLRAKKLLERNHTVAREAAAYDGLIHEVLGMWSVPESSWSRARRR